MKMSVKNVGKKRIPRLIPHAFGSCQFPLLEFLPFEFITTVVNPYRKIINNSS